MAIQMRRGQYKDLDPDKLLPGEWAVSLDERYVHMCFAPGIIMRMATYDAFEEDMAVISSLIAQAEKYKDVAGVSAEEASTAAGQAEAAWANIQEAVQEVTSLSETVTTNKNLAEAAALAANASKVSAMEAAVQAEDYKEEAEVSAAEAEASKTTAAESAKAAAQSAATAEEKAKSAIMSASKAESEAADALISSTSAQESAQTAMAEADRAKTEADRAENVTNIGIATTEKAGLIKPDGITNTVDESGTLHVNLPDSGTTDYRNLSNKPAVNGVELTGDKTLEDLGIQSKGNYLTEETDPTVPEWAKTPEKPSYTAEEVGAAEKQHTHNYAGSTAPGGAAEKAKKIETKRTLNGVLFDGTNDVVYCGVCNSGGLVDIPGYALTVNSRISVLFNYTETNQSPSLNVNGTGAKPIWYYPYGSGQPTEAGAGDIRTGMVYNFIYNGNYWICTEMGYLKEVFQSVSDGKGLIAAAITDKGVETAADDTFATMAENIAYLGQWRMYDSGEFSIADIEHSAASEDSKYVENTTWVGLTSATVPFTFTHPHNLDLESYIPDNDEDYRWFVVGEIWTESPYGFRCGRGMASDGTTAQYFYFKHIPFGNGGALPSYEYISESIGDVTRPVPTGRWAGVTYDYEAFANTAVNSSNYTPLTVQTDIGNNTVKISLSGKALYATRGTLEQIKARYRLFYRK